MRKILLLLILVNSVYSLHAQENQFCVVTFLETGRTLEGRTEYLWIIPCDEFDAKSSQRRIPIYPFIVSDDFYLDLRYREEYTSPAYYLDIMHFPEDKDPLLLEIRNNRRLVQTFQMKFPDMKGRITVRVFITPITGTIERKILLKYDEIKNLYECDKTVYISSCFKYLDSFDYEGNLFDCLRHQYYEQVLYFDGKHSLVQD